MGLPIIYLRIKVVIIIHFSWKSNFYITFIHPYWLYVLINFCPLKHVTSALFVIFVFFVSPLFPLFVLCFFVPFSYLVRTSFGLRSDLVKMQPIKIQAGEVLEWLCNGRLLGPLLLLLFVLLILGKARF